MSKNVSLHKESWVCVWKKMPARKHSHKVQVAPSYTQKALSCWDLADLGQALRWEGAYWITEKQNGNCGEEERQPTYPRVYPYNADMYPLLVLNLLCPLGLSWQARIHYVALEYSNLFYGSLIFNNVLLVYCCNFFILSTVFFTDSIFAFDTASCDMGRIINSTL